MSQKTIQVNFETVTPLWTGDAWQNSKEIRPSSLIGSLRFWFEVICYFSGITNEHNYENGKLKDDLNKEEFKKKVVVNGADFDGIDKTLAELGISLPSRVFGCTGWKGWVRIKGIIFDPKNFNNDPRGRIINGKNWFWGSPSYQGIFEVVFEMESEIVGSIFYPLLTFIEKYGFLGGKWNIGYGRVRIENVEEKDNDGKWNNKKDWRKEEFKMENKIKKFIELNNSLNLNSKPFEFVKYFLGVNNFHCNNERNFEDKISSIPQKIKIAKFNNPDGNYVNLIKELLKKKAEIRNCLRPNSSMNNKVLWNNFRHELLGTTSGGTEGTKIIPWIYEQDGQLKGGFAMPQFFGKI